MIDNKKVVAIIPARGGSKGLPGKNIKKLNGKELIGWTIEAAQACRYVDSVLVSTDSHEIANVARSFKADVPFMRPTELGSDTAKTADVVKHMLNELDEKYDILVLLQPTSPFRNANHIDQAIDLFAMKKSVSVVSVCELDKSPYWSFWVDNEKRIKGIMDGKFSNERRQDLKKAYGLNGALYIQTTKRFLDTKEFVHDDSFAFEMDKKSSIDIDDLVDFKLAEILLENKYD